MKLQLEGWRIAVIWKCATRNKELFESTLNSLNEWITSFSEYLRVKALLASNRFAATICRSDFSFGIYKISVDLILFRGRYEFLFF